MERSAGVNMTIVFILCTAIQVMGDAHYALEVAHFINVGSSAASDLCIHISIIDAFCKTVSTALNSRPDTTIVVCPHDSSEASLSNAVLLYGSYLLLCKGEALDEVVNALAGYVQRSRHVFSKVVDSWNALEHARTLHWLSAPNFSNDAILDIEMAAHYALPANGGVNLIVPDKLLFFSPPASLPSSQAWADSSVTDVWPSRRFSAAFLAELLADLGVTAVVCLGRTGRRDAAAFRRRGLEVHDLDLDPRRPGLLSAMPRLLCLSRAAPGAVAVCGWHGDEAGVGRASVRTLGAAWLMAESGFGAGAAEAWVSMACAAPAGAASSAAE